MYVANPRWIARSMEHISINIETHVKKKMEFSWEVFEKSWMHKDDFNFVLNFNVFNSSVVSKLDFANDIYS